MMLPNVYATLRANATILSLVVENIGRHGSIPQETALPYITWFTVGDQPHDTLSEAPQSDFTTVEIDCWSLDDAQIATLAGAVRSALDTAGIVNRVVVDLRENDTKLYRIGVQADFITQR
jgi:hypothetical protein